MKNKYISTFVSIFLFTILIITIGISTSLMGQVVDESKVNLQQKKSDLLTEQVMAVAYSGYRNGQHPDRGNGAVNPSDEEILEDLEILSHNSNFGLIRLYDSQKNSETVLKLITAHKINLKVMLGIWLDAEISNHEGCPWLVEPIAESVLNTNKQKNKKEIERAIKLANDYQDIVFAINVGNEALVSWNDHMVTVDSVISYVKTVKQSVNQEVTVAENYDWWAKSGRRLANELDFISIHTYPIWEAKDIDQGMSFTIENINNVKKAIPDKKIVISEAGWATIASEFGERASEEKQEQYYNEIFSWADKMNITVFWFEAFDESWKGNPENPLGAEKHWGLFTVDRKAKRVMSEQYPHLMPNNN